MAGVKTEFGTVVHQDDDVEFNGAVEDKRVDGPASPSNQQMLERYINLQSIVNFGTVLLGSWEGFAFTFQFALLNGGPSSMVYGCILVGFGATFVALSLAELASIDPAVGAQYRWAANFAPSAPRFWGLLQGWLTIFAWVTGCAAGPSISAQVMVGLAILNYPEYQPQRWQFTLIMWALVLVVFLLNLSFRKLLNAFELLGGIFHVCFFIIAIVTLAVLAQRSPSEYVFNTFTKGLSGWENDAVTWGLGLLTITFSVNGFDGTLHMSDEVKKVKTRLPRSIIIATVSNSIMLFGFVILLLFSVGDINKVASTPTGLPLIEVFYQATGSKPATNFLVAMPAIVVFFSTCNGFASVSRLIWTFAKDKGLPLSRQLSYVHPTLRLPLNSLALVVVISMLLAIIYIGSSTAFNAIISLQAIALTISYVPPIFFLAIRRIMGTAPEPGPFAMGRWGLPINLLAVVYLVFVALWMPFPQILPTTSSNMNYAGPIIGAIILGALLDWFMSGHKRFKVPVAPNI